MAQKDLFALSSISAATCAAARTCDAHMLITSIYLTNIQLASLASLVWPCCASSHRMQPYTPTVLTGSGVTVLVASISVTLVTCGLGGVASGATASTVLLARVPMARREAAIAHWRHYSNDCWPWKNPEFVPRTGRHVAAYMCIYHVRMGCTSQTTLITACHSVAPGSGNPFLVYQLTGGPLEHDC